MRDLLRRLLPLRVLLYFASLVEDLQLLGLLYDRGSISDLVCSAHDGVPMTEAEETAMWDPDEADDGCLLIVRVWGF